MNVHRAIAVLATLGAALAPMHALPAPEDAMTAREAGVPSSIREVAVHRLGALAERLDEKQLPRAQQLAREISGGATRGAQAPVQSAAAAANPSIE